MVDHARFRDEEDLGSVVWDAEFDLADPEAQATVMQACELRDDAALQATGSQCVMAELAAWAALRNESFPLPRERFNSALVEFLDVAPEWLASLSCIAVRSRTTVLQEASERPALASHVRQSRVPTSTAAGACSM